MYQISVSQGQALSAPSMAGIDCPICSFLTQGSCKLAIELKRSSHWLPFEDSIINT